ncbi:NAD(P)-dependent oxidoreductase [Actinorugispora endophytica]|uniref:Putative NADH-flavin reductase n=1 Tax=Actinorugispora endophytica TaxID=1605990 RepID=A0A4R6V1N5_9ACTN|nr:NAD(P)H-binding protein [Actinorugispora endophytica]TDQ53774.1 putative NADH-flavin reductase [Actinorugispora endophytica]
MRITVLGATGRVGRLVVRQALAAGHEVTAVVRDPARLPVPAHERLHVATVPDITDAEALLPVVTGRDAVVSAVGAASNARARTAPIAAPALRSVLTAMERAGVRRLSAVSATPVGPPADGEGPFTRFVVLPILRRALRDVYADLAAMEEAIAGSGAEWTVVRPPMLVDRPLTGTYRRAVGGSLAGSRTIGRADVADALLTSLDDPATVRQAVGVAA